MDVTFPEFPGFQKLASDDRKYYETFYREVEPYSDFSFNNLLVWFNRHNRLALARHQETLVLRLGNPFDNNDNDEYTLLTNHDAADTISAVFLWQKQQELEQKLVMVPEVVIKNTPGITERFIVNEDPDNKDYIYDVALSHATQGGTYGHMRRRLNYIKTNYGNRLTTEPLDTTDHAVKKLLINTLHTWDSTYRQSGQAKLEGRALDTLLRNADILQTQCLGLFMDSQLIAFCLFHYPPQNGYVIVNHLKCDNSYQHLFDFTFYQLAGLLLEQGITKINLEQDLGLDGLRTHKERLHPCAYLRRFTITPRE